MDGLSLIAGVVLVAFIARHNAAMRRAEVTVKTMPKSRAEVKRPTGKRSRRIAVKPTGKRLMGCITEHKIGSRVMPQRCTYPIPFNAAYVGVYLAFNGQES